MKVLKHCKYNYWYYDEHDDDFHLELIKKLYKSILICYRDIIFVQI